MLLQAGQRPAPMNSGSVYEACKRARAVRDTYYRLVSRYEQRAAQLTIKRIPCRETTRQPQWPIFVAVTTRLLPLLPCSITITEMLFK